MRHLRQNFPNTVTWSGTAINFGHTVQADRLAILAQALTRFSAAVATLATLDRPLRPRSLRIGPITWPDDGWNQLGGWTVGAGNGPAYLWNDKEWCNQKPKRLLRIVRQLDNASAWVEKRAIGQERHRANMAARSVASLERDRVAAKLKDTADV